MSESEIVKSLFVRWGAHVVPAMIDREDAGKLLAISIGLGCIYNENAEAERMWMQTPHPKLRTRPITAVLAGSLDEVLNLVNQERGL